MNELFCKAQQGHFEIAELKRQLKFNEDTVLKITRNALLYAKVVMSTLGEGDTDTVTDVYMALCKHNAVPEIVTYQMCMTFDALSSSNRTFTKRDAIEAMHLYYAFRKGMLDALYTLDPPYYKDGLVYHDAVDVKIEASEYAWKWNLECFYTDWVVCICKE